MQSVTVQLEPCFAVPLIAGVLLACFFLWWCADNLGGIIVELRKRREQEERLRQGERDERRPDVPLM